jgi:hypothetical protein
VTVLTCNDVSPGPGFSRGSGPWWESRLEEAGPLLADGGTAKNPPPRPRFAPPPNSLFRRKVFPHPGKVAVEPPPELLAVKRPGFMTGELHDPVSLGDEDI